MKNQQVSVDFWAMAKSMMMYGFLTLAGWMMLRLFNAVFSLPRRLRTQQQNIQATLQEFQVGFSLFYIFVSVLGGFTASSHRDICIISPWN